MSQASSRRNFHVSFIKPIDAYEHEKFPIEIAETDSNTDSNTGVSH